jgi:hypothetical protein
VPSSKYKIVSELKYAVFWDVEVCRSCVNRRFGGTYRFHLQGRNIRSVCGHADSSLADISTLKMEAIRSSKTSVDTRSTQLHIPENGILHSHLCENLKSSIVSELFEVFF